MMSDFDQTHGNPEEVIPPLPRVSIQVFTETDGVTSVIQQACQDRRMAKAHVKIQTGGAAAAVEAYRSAPTPNVIVIESRLSASTLLGHLDELASECDEGTRVVVIGHVNDVILYRELLRRGVSDYLIAPLNMIALIRSLSDLFGQQTGAPIGRAVSVIGAKGGVGASTIAHNLAFTMVEELDLATCIVDLDLPFGTAGLDFNLDPVSGVIDAANDPDRVDANLLDRIMTSCGEKLSMLAAPATLERTYDFSFKNFEPIVDMMRAAVPNIVYDVPHIWTDWSRRILSSSDEIIIVAAPDLANLRNAKNLVDTLTALRKNDRPPHLVLNFVGMPKRPEIAIAEFAKAIGTDPIGIIPFDPQLFGVASNNGQMLCEVQAKHKATEAFPEIVRVVTGKMEKVVAKRPSPVSMLDPLLTKLKLKKA